MRIEKALLTSLLCAPAAKPAGPSARELAEQNRLRVLRAVSEHGHLRTTDIAAACWPDARYALQMSQRTTKVLCTTGLLLARRNAHGGTSYVLTRPGARTLEARGIAARHGLDLASVSGSTFAHHALTSRWCIEKHQQGFEVHTEYAIRSGHAPISALQLIARFGKMPDAVLIRGTRLWLVETESAPKASEDLMRIVGLVEKADQRVHAELTYTMAGLYIVFDADLNHSHRLARAGRQRWWGRSAGEKAALASRITLAHVHRGGREN